MKKILFALLAATMLIGCQEKKDDNVIQIGVIAPLTGYASLPGEMCIKGLEMAKLDKDLKFEYVIADCKSSTKDAIAAYRNLYNKGIRYYIVCGGQFAMAIAPQTKDKDVIMFATATANLDLLDVTNRCFRMFPHPNQIIENLIDFSQEKFPSKDVAIIYLQNDAYAHYANLYEEKIKAGGSNVVMKEGYAATQNDFKSIIAKVTMGKPNYIYLSSMGESILTLTKQLLTDPRTSDIPVIGDMNYSLPNAKMIIPKTKTPIFYIDANIDNNFVKEYHKMFQQAPNAYSYYAYTIPYILNDVLKNTDYQIATQLDYIKKTDFKIASQLISFDNKGEVNLPLKIYSLY